METKGITCKIPVELHERISEEIRETESTMSQFIEMVIREHYEKGANKVMEKGRTLAFQVSEELFQKVKEYLDRYERTYHRRLTQKEFVVGLIEQALEEAEDEFEAARTVEQEERTESGWEAAESDETDAGTGPWDEENGGTEEPAEEEPAGETDEEPTGEPHAWAQQAGDEDGTDEPDESDSFSDEDEEAYA